ncbi:MAG: serine/threonine protein kinase [Actinomycetota bacterium]|nr:serine/threonine protein kinase [Actinomycetota bacterium]
MPGPPEDLAVGARLGEYLLEQVLGEGGMGIVFRAVRETDGETVALKVLRRELSQDETYRRRFVHEARAAGEVRERHLVPVLDAGEQDGRSYLAVAFIPGKTLEQRIASEGPLPIADVVRITAEIGAGLDALHAAELIHRDVKSSNVILAEGDGAMLTDFGLAKGRAYTVLTRPGQVMGTLDYIAPEMIRGQPASPASDIYALGCLIYECLRGHAPFAEKAVYAVATAHLDEEPEDPCAGRGDCPEGFGWAVLRALEKEPARRPGTATAYAQMLGLAARGSG